MRFLRAADEKHLLRASDPFVLVLIVQADADQTDDLGLGIRVFRATSLPLVVLEENRKIVRWVRVFLVVCVPYNYMQPSAARSIVKQRESRLIRGSRI